MGWKIRQLFVLALTSAAAITISPPVLFAGMQAAEAAETQTGAPAESMWKGVDAVEQMDVGGVSSVYVGQYWNDFMGVKRNSAPTLIELLEKKRCFLVPDKARIKVIQVDGDGFALALITEGQLKGKNLWFHPFLAKTYFGPEAADIVLGDNRLEVVARYRDKLHKAGYLE